VVVDKITTIAYEDGLSKQSLDILVDIVTLPNELDQASINAIIRNLYPAERVRDDVVLRVVACLGQGSRKASPPAQAALLKWLIMVYDILENQKILGALYGVLFNLLDMISIRLVVQEKNILLDLS